MLAADEGLNIPLIYNSGGYDEVAALHLLEGIIDIYMPDFKFWDSPIATQTCDAPDYPEAARQALLEMHRQVGDLVMDENGLATRGLLVRHLVLPQNLAGTRMVMRFIATQISSNTYVNVMSQYRPCGWANEIPAPIRPPTAREFELALQEAEQEGITRLDQRRRVFVIR